MKYYTLIALVDGKWQPQFGDYDRNVVDEEAHDVKAYFDKGIKLRIIKTGDTQAEIDYAIETLNEGGELV